MKEQGVLEIAFIGVEDSNMREIWHEKGAYRLGALKG